MVTVSGVCRLQAIWKKLARLLLALSDAATTAAFGKTKGSKHAILLTG